MLKDIFRRKEIDHKAQLITATIVASYPLEVDRQCGVGERPESKMEKIPAVGHRRGY